MNPTIPANAHAHGFDPYGSIPSGDVGWFGGDLYRAAKKTVKKAAKVVKRGYAIAKQAAPMVEAAFPQIKKALAYTPYGVVGNVAFEAMKAGIKGQNFAHILEASARGAIPDEIEAAIDVASDVVRGKNVIKSVLNNAGKVFAEGSPERQAFDLAKGVLLKQGGADLRDLAGARRLLDSEGARRAFDAAIGTAAKAAKAEKASKPRFVANVAQIAKANTVTSKPKVNFQPLNPRAANLLAQLVRAASNGALFGRTETAGLEENATVYVVENGDSPWTIAKKLTTDGNRWRELVKANPQKKTQASGSNAGGFVTLFAGERLKLPASWSARHASTLTADALGQARAILKVWSESDGANEAGVNGYGDKPEDSSMVWGPRDKLMLISFLNWLNRKGASLPVSGELVDRSADALREWVAQHAATANAPASAPAPAPVPVPVPAPVPAPAPQPEPIAASTPAAVPAPEAAPSYTPATLPQQYVQLIDYAKGLKSPAQIRAYANEFRSKGMLGPADELDGIADRLEAQQFGTPDPTVPPSNVIPLVVDGVAPQSAQVPAQAPANDDDMGLLMIGGLALAKFAHLF